MTLRRACYAVTAGLLLHLAIQQPSQIAATSPTVIDGNIEAHLTGEVADIPQHVRSSDASPTASRATPNPSINSKPPRSERPPRGSAFHKSGAEPVVVGFDAQGREILDVPDFSNSLLTQPQITGSPPVTIRDGSEAGEILEVIDNSNSQLAGAQYTGVVPQEIEVASEDIVLEVTSWPTVYEVRRTGTEPYEVYDPSSGTTILEAD